VDLGTLDGAELERLFRAAPAGELASGPYNGTFLVAPGTRLCAPAAAAIRTVLWQGKYVEGSRLRNLVTPLGVPAVTAAISVGASRLDGRPCVVIDYRPTRLLPARPVRDEVREVAPSVHLGMMWLGGMRLTPWLAWFCLVPAQEASGDYRP
jgi:hypothetical protein